MSYAKKFTPEQAATIAPIIKEIEALDQGDHFSLQDTPEALDYLRFLIYSWLYQTGIKSAFILKRLSLKELRVVRKQSPSPLIINQEETEGITFCLEHLLEIDEESTVEHKIRDAVSGRILSPEFATEALFEWRRLQGIGGID